MTASIDMRVQEILSSVLGVPPERLGSQASMTTIPEWDSIRHLTVILLIEQEFNIKLDVGEAMTLNSQLALVRAIDVMTAPPSPPIAPRRQ